VPLVAPGPIETERLAVRTVVESDLPALLEVNSSEEVTALLPYGTWKSTVDAQAWLHRMRGIEATGLAFQWMLPCRQGLPINRSAKPSYHGLG